MNRFVLLFVLLIALFLVIFFVFESLHINLFTALPIGNDNVGLSATLSYCLLVGDILFPVPSSMIMIANGVLLGLWKGTLLSIAGSVSASCVGYAIGRNSSLWIAKFISPDEQAQAQTWLKRWGLLAIVFTRPVPLLAESVSIMAGMQRSVSWLAMIAASTLGCLPAAALYAWAGANALDADYGTLVFLLVLAITLLLWLGMKFLKKK